MKKFLFLWEELWAQPWLHFLFFITMIIAVGFSLAFQTVDKTIASYIDTQFLAKLPPRTIRVTPKPVRTLPNLFGIQPRPRGSFIDAATLRRIRRLDGVKTVYPFVSLQVPMQIQISLFGFTYQSDVVAIGVPWEFIRGDVPSRYRRSWQRWKEGDPIIALLPSVLLDMYNQTLAAPNQLPVITEDFAKGQQFRLVFGQSSLRRLPEPLTVAGELAGFTRRVGEIAVLLPSAVVEHYNTRFGKTAPEYSFVLVEASDHESLLSLTPAIQRLRLNVSSETTLSQELLRLRETLTLVFRLLEALIWVLCGVAIGLSAFVAAERRQSYYHLLRILGESRVFILFAVAVKYVLFVLLSTWAADRAFEELVRRMPPALFPFPITAADKPDTLFLWLAVGVALLPSLSLLSSRPANRL